MKTILYALFFLLALSIAANAQRKIADMKWKNNFMQRLHQNQNLKSTNENFKLKINPYWQDVDAPHTYNSLIMQIKVPCFGVVWARINYDSLFYDSKVFARTADNGKTWRYDSIPSPPGYALGSLSAIDGNTCYASMYDGTDGQGGGVYKTTDGGATWKKLGIGQLFSDSNFVDFVYFFDARNGIVVGDNDKTDTSYLEIYTTADAGKNWQRVPTTNMQPTIGSAYSFGFNVYTVFQNRIWFKVYDSQGNLYLSRSDDFGRHWKLFPFNVPEFGFDFAFEDKLNGLAVGFPFDGGQSFEAATHDGGKTWTQVTDFTGYVMGGFLTVIPGTHTYISTLEGHTPVYGSSYSRDGGKSWTLIDTGVNALHTAVAFLNPFVGWTGRGRSLDAGGGAYKWKYKFSLDNDENGSSITKNNLSNTINARLYPNPVKNHLTVEGLNASIKTKLSLYNISGKLIQQLNVTANSYTVNVQKLPAGSYYITLQSDKKVSTLKFVKE